MDELTSSAMRTVNGYSPSAFERIKEFAEKSPGTLDGAVKMTSETSFEQDGKIIDSSKQVTALSFKNGMLHSDKGPAVAFGNITYTDGNDLKLGTTVLYMKNGQLDRADGPAALAPPDQAVWARDGKLHRENGPAAMIDGKPVFALDGKELGAAEYGKKQGLGALGKDWFVDRDTGSIAVGMGTPNAQVITMHDAGQAPSRSVDLQPSPPAQAPLQEPVLKTEAPLPALHAASDKQREWGEKERDKVLTIIRAQATPEKAQAVVQKIGQDRDMSNAAFWIGTRNMEPTARVMAVMNAVENPGDRARLKPFEKAMGVSR